jgi:hypothetical protein
MFKVLLALLIVSSAIHALIMQAKKVSFNPLLDPIFSISSFLSYFPRTLTWMVLLVSIGFIIFVASSILKK